MSETVLEVIPDTCRAAMEKRVEFQHRLLTSGLPQLEISLPFSIVVRCDGNDIYVVKLDKESKVTFTWGAVYYRRQGEEKDLKILLTSMNVLELLLLHHLERHAGVLSRLLELARKRGSEIINSCRGTIDVALASKLLL